MKYTPIALFCFRRLDTLNICVESLKLCPEAIHSELIIFSDAARNEAELLEVNQLRSYLNEIDGFKSIKINLRKNNLGVDYNIINGIKEMSENCESFIVVEDDLIVSRDFLKFMNAGLNFYKSFDRVLTLSAFNYVKTPKNYIWDIYFAKRINPWGWATWSNKIKDVDFDLAIKNKFLNNRKEMKEFNEWGSDRTRMLKNVILGKIRTWDIQLDYYLFKNDYLTVYSCKNLVINNGFNDKRASNTIGYNRFKVLHEKNNNIYFNLPDFIFINKHIKYKYVSKNSFLQRFFTQIFKKLNFYNAYDQ
jgi:hypothetical protein